MLRSMFSGVSGLRSHQTMMDVVGNNIANVNTAGYKGTRSTFQESLTQVTRGATAPLGAGAGGVNPLQIGLGVRVGAIDGMFGQGALQTTGRATDLAVVGESWFVMDTPEGQAFTRAGAFSFDAEGKLVGSNGEVVRVRPEAAGTAPGGGFAVDFAEYSGVSINNRGEIRGRDTDGIDTHLGTIQMATIPNPGGMERLGNGLFGETANSGAPEIGDIDINGVNGIGGGAIQSGTLEMSNVDLAQEFTNLILAQRGFQANSRIITSSDEMLQDLVNLKR